MKAYFIKKHSDAVIPKYESELAACCDLTLPEDIELLSGTTNIVPVGLVAIPPKGYHWHIYLRSSTPLKYPSLILANCVGIIDEDYCGEEDELKLILRNDSIVNYYILKGTRLAQMRLVKNIVPTTEETTFEQFNKKSRGGLGSTGS